MRLAKTDVIAGYPANDVRRLMRAIRNHTVYYPDVRIAHHLGLPLSEGSDATRALAEAGLLKPAPFPPDEDGTTWWRISQTGTRVANALFTKPVKRTTAEKAVTDMVARVTQFNATPGKYVWIDQITIFGSYCDPDAATLGDVDVAVALSDRNLPGMDPLEYAYQSGRTFKNFFDELAWSTTEALQVVKNRSRILQVTTQDPSGFNPKQVVYDRLS